MMKRIIFIVASILISYAAQGQYKNIEKLPKKLRDSILVEVANKAINQYSEGYLRPEAVPIIEDLGPLKKFTGKIDLEYMGVYPEYIGVYLFAVYYRGTEEEHNYHLFNKNYLVKVFIRADNAKAINIRYIDDGNSTYGGLDEEKTINSLKDYKRRFVSLEEREERSKRNTFKVVNDTTGTYYWKKFDERVRHIRDSIMRAKKRSAELKRKAREEKQKADTL